MISHETADNWSFIAAICAIVGSSVTTAVMGFLWRMIRYSHGHREKRGALHAEGVVKLFEKEIGN